VTRQRFGARIQAVNFSEAWYRDNMPPFKSAFEEGSLTIPADRDVHDDIHALRLVNGVARIPVKRTEDESGQRHGDAAIAAALAYAASSADPEEYGYRPAPRTSTSTDLNPDSPHDDMHDADDMGLGMRGSVDL
jgi:phage FluMu gp28-like protein